MAKRKPRGNIKVTSVLRKEPDARLYALALIELARDQLAAERAAGDAVERTDQDPTGPKPRS
jgi:hypothetical protein